MAGITKPVQPASQPTLATIKIKGTPITPNAASQYLVGSQTLTLGGQITVSGTAVSLDPSAAVLVVAGITTPVQPAVQPTLAAISINDTPIMANSASQYIVGSQTLIPGAPAITVSGTRYSIAPLASYTVVGGTTYQVSPYRATLIIGGVVVTPNAVGDYIVGSQALMPGGSAITVSGTRYSLASGDSYLVVGSITETLAIQMNELGLGGYIVSVLGASPTVTGLGGGGGGLNVTLSTGGAKRVGCCYRFAAAGAPVLLMILLIIM